VETNGNNCFISLPVAIGAALLPDGTPGLPGSDDLFDLPHHPGHEPIPQVGAHGRAAALRAHAPTANLILPPDHHEVHHTAPYAKYYCITVGWLNEALFRLRFFQTLEKLITLSSE